MQDADVCVISSVPWHLQSCVLWCLDASRQRYKPAFIAYLGFDEWLVVLALACLNVSPSRGLELKKIRTIRERKQ